MRNLAVNAGDVLSFDFNFLVNETAFEAPLYNDFFFSAIEGISNQTEATAAGSPLVTSSTIFNRETGWTSVQYTFSTAGTYDVGFGVMDATDDQVAAAVLLDNIRKTPEPGTGLLLGMGLVMLSARLPTRVYA